MEARKIWPNPRVSRDTGTLLEAVLQSLPIEVVVLAPDGEILFANRSWHEFAAANGASAVAVGAGVNYLEVVRRAVADGSPLAREALEGVASVLEGRADHFALEYPCPAPGSDRWFLMQVDPIAPPRGAVVLHSDVTARKVAERRVAASYERYALATLAGGVGLWDWDLTSGAMLIDPSLKALLGFSDTEVPNRVDAWMRLVHPDDQGLVVEETRRALAGESRILDVSHRMVAKDGRIRWFLARGCVLRDARGQAVRMVGLDADITAQREARLALERQQRKYADIFEAADVAIFEVDCTGLPGLLAEAAAHGASDLAAYLDAAPAALGRAWQTLVVRDANPAAIRLLGASSREELLAWRLDDPPDAALAAFRDHVLSFASGATTCEAQLKLRTRSGQERHVIITSRFPSDRTLDSVLVCAHDVTGLMEVQRRYEMATASGGVAVFDVVPATGVLHVDQALYRLIGIEPSELRSRSAWLERIAREDRPRALAEEARILAVDAPRDADGNTPIPDAEYRVVHRDGTSRWVLIRGTVVRDAGGTPIRVIGTVTDITGRCEAEEALRRGRDEIRDLAARLIVAQEEERRRLARELHDDLNQRLAGIAIAIADVKQRSADVSGAVRQQLDRAGEQLAQLVGSVRQLSHQMHPGVLEHAGLVLALRSLAQDLASRGELEVDLAFGELDQPLPGDVALVLYRVAQEALRNVVKHAGTGSAEVFLGRVGEMLVLTVRDHGVGFDPTIRSGGQGLGLLSIHERVRVLGGDVRVRTSPGAGTEVTVRVPEGRPL